MTITLTNRLLLFFLGGLAVVLGAFSGTMYALVRTHLSRQLNERATATLDTLVAATEVEGDGLEWEPNDRRILLRGEGSPFAWAIFDEGDGRIDGSPNPIVPLDAYAGPEPDVAPSRVTVSWEGVPWRVVRRTLRHPKPEDVRSEATRKRYRSLTFVTAWSTAPVSDTLRTLASVLGSVSVALWVTVGFCGRWVCRWALIPVIRMTAASKRLRADAPHERLPVPPARDELRDLAVAFNDGLTRLQDAYERQRRFTAEVSHQLRTPLAAMLGQLEVALRRDRDPDEYRRVIATAITQSGRLSRVIEMLLYLARADAEATLPGREDIDLAEWLPRHLSEGWSDHPRFAEIHLEASLPGLFRIAAQPFLLGHALDNLLDNALKYSTTGSPVTVTVERDERGIRLAVMDRGRGIEAADVKLVWTPFFRANDVKKSGIDGVGLGLAVASRIVASTGGTIHVESRPGGGSRFVMQFTDDREGRSGPD